MWVIWLSVLGMVFSVLFIVRSGVVKNAKIRAIMVCDKNIKAGLYGERWKEELDKYGTHDYIKMMFMVHKWTFKQFYPDLREENKDGQK